MASAAAMSPVDAAACRPQGPIYQRPYIIEGV